MLKEVKAIIIETIFPKTCLSCGKIGDFFCQQCQAKIRKIELPLCPFCRRISAQGHSCLKCRQKKALNGATVYGYYQSQPLKLAIKALKYGNIFGLSEYLAKILIEKIEKDNLQFDIITSVPISKKRLRERGYNQTELLGRVIAEYFKKPFFMGLIKAKDTLPQVGLKRTERLYNLKNSFVVTAGDIKDKKVLLIDDVLTTGATLNEVAKVLKKAGARQVWGAVLARE